MGFMCKEILDFCVEEMSNKYHILKNVILTKNKKGWNDLLNIFFSFF